MSGAVELAGLALGAFPVVIYLLESFQEGYDYFKAWRSFRREYTEILNKLRQQQILLRQHIEVMLGCVNDSEFDSHQMTQNLEGDKWRSSVLDERLQEKLRGDDEYEVYKSTLHSIKSSLDKMDKKLKKFGPQVNKASNSASKGLDLERQFQRLRFTLRHKVWHGKVEELGRQIECIGKILGGAEDLAHVRQSRGFSISQGFKRVRSQAASLHEAISRGWTCVCQDEHACKLLLADRTKPSGPSPSDPKTGSREFRVIFPLRYRVWTKPHTLIHQKDAWCTVDATMVPLAESQQISLRRDIIEESTIYSDSVFTASMSTAATALTTYSNSPTCLDSGERKPSLDSDRVSRLRSSSTTSSQVGKRGQIKDLCHRLHNYGNEVYLGHLSDERGSWHQLHVSPSLTLNSSEFLRIVTLGAILDGSISHFHSGRDTPLELTRRERMSVALTLAYALMELHLTPWVPANLFKTDVYFFQRKDGVVLTRNPFLLSEVASTKKEAQPSPPAFDNHDDHGKALLSLGILIMELWFGESIESKSCWKEVCGADDQQRHFTYFNAALTWQREAQSSGGKKLHDITQRCIYGNFGVTTRNFSNDQFATAVFEGVIRELKGLLDCFEEADSAPGLENSNL